jgi:hypothetical protein
MATTTVPVPTRLLNVSDQVISYRHGGKLWTFAPHGQKGSLLPVPSDVTEVLLQKFGHDLQVVGAYAQRTYVPKNEIKRYYVGNFSGDPDAPKEFETVKIDKDGNEKTIRVKNSIAAPRTFTRTLGREMEIKPPGSVTYIDPYLGERTNDYPMQVTLPGRPVVIPPFSVVEVTYQQFYSIMLSERGNRTFFCRPSRDLTWVPDYTDPSMTLDRFHTYLSLFGETPSQEAGAALVPGTEAELRARWIGEGKDEDAVEEAVESARWDAFARGRLRAMNLDHALPTQAEFEAAWAASSNGTPKKRGRPPKIAVPVVEASAGVDV